MLWAYFKFELLLVSRKKSYLTLSIMLPLVFYIIFTAMLDLPKAYETQFYKAYMYSMATFSLSSFCIMTFPLEMIEDNKIGWAKNLFKTPLTPKYYYAGKVLKLMCMFSISIIALFLTGWLYKGVEMSAGEWIGSGLLLWLGSSMFLSIGVLIAQMKDIQKASAIANILYLGLAVVGGLWFPTDQFPDWLKEISYLTPTYNLRELSLSLTTSGGMHVQSLLILMVYCILFISIALIIRKKTEVI
ncbi:ABC transporter permease [Mammaliicoccus sp. Dog046]|uniref:ABC transporter permease n=1 Tax=Mammaliicoccus sp. Dog046 TaxID=3034233 RepID=UPI002B25F7F8|nr:ABC transporter permease [Mammaliicoccus sp. Dog046]WQK85108.1 ABC transporter permease [Mammaliicoccus sp. Dog046]